VGDQSDEMLGRRHEREAEEYRQYQSPTNQLQRTLDWHWQMKLARDAERAHRRRAPDERPRGGSNVVGDYDPIAR
jgi:hypothetical protein